MLKEGLKNIVKHSDPVKRKHRAKNIFRELIKQAVRESRQEGGDMTEKRVREALRERDKRRKIAKKRGIEPGTTRWRAIVRDARRNRSGKRGKQSKESST